MLLIDKAGVSGSSPLQRTEGKMILFMSFSFFPSNKQATKNPGACGPRGTKRLTQCFKKLSIQIPDDPLIQEKL